MIVIGVGNHFRHDDEAGLEVVRRLNGKVPASVSLIEFDGDLTGLISLWQGHDHAILVDAASSGRPPGSIVRICPTREPMPRGFSRWSSHGFGVAEVVALATTLDVMPGEITIFAIEGDDFEPGTGLSSPVSAAIEEVVVTIAEELREHPARGRVREESGRDEFRQDSAPVRVRLRIRGAVQGVGFRPFVARLAGDMRLNGWVRNAPYGAEIEIEGAGDALTTFVSRLRDEKPPLASIGGIESSTLEPLYPSRFDIMESEQSGERTAVVLPDIATCGECRREIFDPRDRRYRYPFTNCTNCGPRYSILLSLPYDRARTTMQAFPLCNRCRTEYEDPADRRFHAQPVACPDCGPQLSLLDAAGARMAEREPALSLAESALREGRIVAVQGLSGFHLMVDAGNDDAVRRLRAKKAREEKPFALLYPSLESVRVDACLSPAEEALLASSEAPIVLVRRCDAAEPGGTASAGPGIPRRNRSLPETSEPRANSSERSVAPDSDRLHARPADSVAPGNPYLGVFLPSNPLHHLLLADLGFPVVATSGNLSDEPICHDPAEALERLAGVADLFLVHDRPIARPLDDSIACVTAGRPLILRRSRGYAPLTLPLGEAVPDPVLGVGAHLKSTIALARGGEAVVGEYLGDMDSARTGDRFRKAGNDLQDLYSVHVQQAACDMHPEYPSAIHARRTWPAPVEVQHHHAHILSCLADNEAGLDTPVLGVSWDGTGWGPDGTIWGGEFLRVSMSGYERVGHLRTFRLPGAGAAVREGRRAALGLLYEMFGAAIPEDLPPVRSFSPAELKVMTALLRSGTQSPRTSSAGRLFDALASILDLRQRSAFEGQAAMDLEFAADRRPTDDFYPDPGENWGPLVRSVLDECSRGVDRDLIASRIHNTLAEAMVTVARRIGLERVALSGGCFQNRRLLERAVKRLSGAGFRVLWHRRVPPNDAGIALGQVVAAAGRQQYGA